MNAAVPTAVSGDFSGGGTEYYNLYYQIVENKRRYFCKWLIDEKKVDAIPSTTIHAKAAASIAGLGFIGHNTQVITPEYGPQVCWIAVLTGLELEPDEPFIRDLCAEQPLCKNGSLCVNVCPYQAIFPDSHRAWSLERRLSMTNVSWHTSLILNLTRPGKSIYAVFPTGGLQSAPCVIWYANTANL